MCKASTLGFIDSSDLCDVPHGVKKKDGSGDQVY